MKNVPGVKSRTYHKMEKKMLMKLRFPDRFIAFTLILGLAIACWSFTESSRDDVSMDLETSFGDVSLLANRKLNIRYEHLPDSNNRIKVSDLDVRFTNEGTCESFFSSKREQQKEGATYNRVKAYMGEWDSGQIVHWSDITNSPDGETEINIQLDDSLHIFNIPPDTEGFGQSFNSVIIRIDGVAYFSVPSNVFDGSVFYDTEIPVKYNVDSGIWSYDLTNPDAIPENIVPCPISSEPSSSKVFGLYALEEEGTLALLTLENSTDLYVTLYDTKTGTAHDPVMIFQIASGTVEPYLMRYNDTCPMGSIYVKVTDGEDDSQSNAFALSLDRNQHSGRIESTCYAMPVYDFIFYDWTTFAFEYAFLEFDNNSPFVKQWCKSIDDIRMYLDPELFYIGEEVWIVRYDPLDAKSYHTLESDQEASDSNLLRELLYDAPDHQYVIQAYNGSKLLYEGILNVDLSFTCLNTEIKDYISPSLYDSVYWDDVNVLFELE